MMSSEIITSIQEGYKLNIVILGNHGFSSIGGWSRGRFGRLRNGLSVPRVEEGQMEGLSLIHI